MYILKGGLIVDGTRSKPYNATLVINDGIIEDITTNEINCEGSIIDVSGNIISPGFIDIHSHSDISYFLPYTPESKIYQGVTTEIIGNCGSSVVPLSKENKMEVSNFFNSITEIKSSKTLKSNNIEEYKKELAEAVLPVNLGILIGHGTLRGTVVGFEDRRPTPEEMDEMCNHLERELKNGAFGLSLGLIYPPGNFSKTEELIRLAKVLYNNNRILTVHLRNEGDRVFEAVDEMIYIAKVTGVHLHISHLKLMGKKQWQNAARLLEKIDHAISSGLTITCDQYPYDATATSLSALIPRWAHNGGTEKMLERLKHHNSKLDNDIESEMDNRGGPRSVTISGTKGYIGDVEGLNIEEASEMLKLNAVETVKYILINAKGNATAVYHTLAFEDVVNIMKKMYVSVGSDGFAFSYDQRHTTTNPHPRNCGTYPQYFETIRENNILSIEDAVYKATRLPAETLGIKDRGVLLPGKAADITVFNFNNIKDNSTYLSSVAKPTGIDHVFVNGKPVILDGEKKGLDNGKVLLSHR